MGTPEQDIQAVRKKRTILLLVGGAASLALPLLSVLYVKMNEAKTARPPDSAVMFDRREGGEAKVNVSQTVTLMNPAAQAGPGPSSLPVAGGMTMTPPRGGYPRLGQAARTTPIFRTIAAAAAPAVRRRPVARRSRAEPAP